MAQEAPYFLVAFVIANFFYKFHSFGLELFGFMLTWLVLSWVGNTTIAWVRNRNLQASKV